MKDRSRGPDRRGPVRLSINADVSMRIKAGVSRRSPDVRLSCLLEDEIQVSNLICEHQKRLGDEAVVECEAGVVLGSSFRYRR